MWFVYLLVMTIENDPSAAEDGGDDDCGLG